MAGYFGRAVSCHSVAEICRKGSFLSKTGASLRLKSSITKGFLSICHPVFLPDQAGPKRFFHSAGGYCMIWDYSISWEKFMNPDEMKDKAVQLMKDSFH